MIYKARTTVIARNEMTKQFRILPLIYGLPRSLCSLAMTKTNELIELFNKIKGDNPHPSIKNTNELIKWVTPAPYLPHFYEQKEDGALS
jgi:hypothetical protein